MAGHLIEECWGFYDFQARDFGPPGFSLTDEVQTF